MKNPESQGKQNVEKSFGFSKLDKKNVQKSKTETLLEHIFDAFWFAENII